MMHIIGKTNVYDDNQPIVWHYPTQKDTNDAVKNRIKQFLSTMTFYNVTTTLHIVYTPTSTFQSVKLNDNRFKNVRSETELDDLIKVITDIKLKNERS